MRKRTGMRKTKAGAEETRMKLLETAEHLFFEHGPAAVTFDKIALSAGMTRGALYWHFANKADLLRALLDLAPLPAEEVMERALEERHDDPLTLLQQVVIECLGIIANDPRRQRIYTILYRCDYRGEFLSVLERERETNLREYRQLVALFELAQEKALLSPRWTAQAAAKTLYWLLGGILSDWLKDRSTFDLVSNTQEVLENLFRSFRAAPPADMPRAP